VGNSHGQRPRTRDRRGGEQHERGKGTPPARSADRVAAPAPAVPALDRTRASGIAPAATTARPGAETDVPPGSAPPPPGLAVPAPKAALSPRRLEVSPGVSVTVPALVPRGQTQTRAASALPAAVMTTPARVRRGADVSAARRDQPARPGQAAPAARALVARAPGVRAAPAGRAPAGQRVRAAALVVRTTLTGLQPPAGGPVRAGEQAPAARAARAAPVAAVDPALRNAAALPAGLALRAVEAGPAVSKVAGLSVLTALTVEAAVRVTTAAKALPAVSAEPIDQEPLAAKAARAAADDSVPGVVLVPLTARPAGAATMTVPVAARAATAEPVRAGLTAAGRAPGAAPRPAGADPGLQDGRRDQAAAETVTKHAMPVDQVRATTGQAAGAAGMNPKPGRAGNCRSFRPASTAKSSRPRCAPRSGASARTQRSW
jgi:hypothetical protein